MALMKMKDICLKIGSGATPRGGKEAYIDSGISLIRSQNVLDFAFSYDGLAHINEQQAEKLSNVIVESGDVLLNITGDSVARACIVDDKVLPARVNQHVAIIRANTDYVLGDYLLYFLQMSKMHLLQIAAGGATRNALTKGMIEDLELNVPSISVQNKIVSVIGNIQKTIESNIKINENLLQQAEAIYKDWFCDRFGENGSVPWPKTTIGDISSLVVRGITPKYNEDADQIVINQKCIRNHMVDLTPARRHVPKAITEKWLIQGDLLINSTGEGTLGRTAQIWFVPNNLTVDSHVTIVRPRSVVLRNYIGLWGLTHEAEIESLHTGSTGQTELPRERVKTMEIPLPDESTLSRFNELITPMTQAIVKNQQENIRLAELRDALLPRLMSGELDVSELNL